MSVMIKEMNFPKNCMECDLHFIARGLDNECIFSNDTVDDCTERRLYRCPLVEIPTPHGRLIDADELKKKLEKHREMCGDIELAHGIDEAIRILENATIIIEAEVSE